MTKTFHSSNTPELFLGPGAICNLNELTARYKGAVLLITGGSTPKNTPFVRNFMEDLKLQNRFAGLVKITHEPSPDDIDGAVRAYEATAVGCVVSIGGGSVIDGGKAISAMLKSKGSIKGYLEGVGTKTPTGRKIPFVAVPTTAGTGSEATQNAVITQTGPDGFKKSLRHMNYVPDVAVVDPELTFSCSPETTAASGMDAFTQLVESYVSTRATPFTDALALDAIGRLYRSLERAWRNGRDVEARYEMAYAAHVSGITLANAGLGVVHGFAQPLGSFFGIPHGAVCGTLMAAVNRITLRKLMDQGPANSTAFRKYVNIGKLFDGGKGKSDADYLDFFISELERLTKMLQLPFLSDYGLAEKNFDEIVAATRLKNHPVKLDEEDLKEVLEARL